MMKRLLSTTALVILLSLGVCAQVVCNRHTETLGGYSLCVPTGWSVEEREGQKYKLFFAPPDAGFTANINVKDEANTYLLADYADASVKQILTNYDKIGATSIKVLEQTKFTTANGVVGIRVAFRTEYKGLLIRTLQYYFNGKTGQKLIATGTFLEEKKEALDPVFDRALKSFQLEK